MHSRLCYNPRTRSKIQFGINSYLFGVHVIATSVAKTITTQSERGKLAIAK